MCILVINIFVPLQPLTVPLSHYHMLARCISGDAIYMYSYTYPYVIYRLWPVMLCNSISQTEAELPDPL